MIVHAKRPTPRPRTGNGEKPVLTTRIVTARSPADKRKQARLDLEAEGTENSPRFRQVDEQFEAATTKWKAKIARITLES